MKGWEPWSPAGGSVPPVKILEDQGALALLQQLSDSETSSSPESRARSRMRCRLGSASCSKPKMDSLTATGSMKRSGARRGYSPSGLTAKCGWPCGSKLVPASMPGWKAALPAPGMSGED